MPTLDLKKSFKELYKPSVDEPVLIDVPPLNFLMVDGEGDPNSAQEFRDAMQALYSVAYTLKFKLKRLDPPLDYTIMPLEGLWPVREGGFDLDNKSSWAWTVMIAQADFVTPEHVAGAMVELEKKKRLPALGKVRLERYEEGRAAQIMHVGPYSEEQPTTEKLHAFIHAQGLHPRGKHHEIYMGNPRTSAPEKLKTVIRQPVG